MEDLSRHNTDDGQLSLPNTTVTVKTSMVAEFVGSEVQDPQKTLPEITKGDDASTSVPRAVSAADVSKDAGREPSDKSREVIIALSFSLNYHIC